MASAPVHGNVLVIYHKFVPPNFLKPGDTITCEIEGIGSITNTIV